MRVQKSIIAPKLAKLKTVIPNKSTTESIQGVLFKDNHLSATNYEVGIKTLLDVNSDETFIISSRAIDLIENLPDGEIEIVPEDNCSIKIKAKNISNKFQSYNPDTFPNLDASVPDITAGSISSKDFEKGIKSIIYAVGSSVEKPILSGIYFESVGGKLNIVSCDGYRMAWFKMNYENEFKFVVPKSTIQKVLSVGINGDIEIIYNHRNAVFKSDEYTIYTSLLEGNYINYPNMFVKRDNSTIVNKSVFLEAIKRCMLCMDEKNKGVVKLQMVGDRLTISTISTISEYTEEMKLEAPIDEDLTIGFNGMYLLDFLKGFDSEDLELTFGIATQPLIADDGEQSALVLPVRIKG